MADVKGIGGVFIDSSDAEKLAEWYQRCLGIEMEAQPDKTGYYKVFQTRDVESGVIHENPVFAITQVERTLAPDSRGFVLNLRVDNLMDMLTRLKSIGVKVEGKIMEWAGGKHAWIRDLDGNRIELFEELFFEEVND